MKKEIIRLLFILLIAILTSVIVVACGGDEEPTPEPPPPPTATPLPATATTAPATATTAPPAEAPTATTAPTDTTATTTAVSETVSVSAVQPESPIAPTSPLDPPAVVPSLVAVEMLEGKTSSEAGAIIGRIVISRSDMILPVSDMIVGVADILTDDKTGKPVATGYDPATPYRAVTDAQGRFAINLVKPGAYALVLDAVFNQVMLTDIETEEAVFADVKAGEVVDVGLLHYESLGIPGYQFKDEEK